MKKFVFMLLVSLAAAYAQAQTIRVGNKFWDGESLYTVKEIRMGKIFYMTTSQGNELTLEKVKGDEYKIIPNRQADDCPFGAEFGWRVRHICQDGTNFLAIRKPNGDVMWTMSLTTDNEERCQLMQKMMGQEEPWNAVNGFLLNRAYLHRNVATKKELRILRNKILAYHGYRFQSKDLQDYFAKVSWYKPVNDNNAIKLNIVEQTNIQLIKSEESARPDDPEEKAQPEGVTSAPEEDWTEEAVAKQVRRYFDAVNETFAEGSGLNPFDLDKNYYSAHWNKVYGAVCEKEGNVETVEQRFFIDDNHWTAGMATPLEVKDIKVELLTGDMAEAVFTLVAKGHGLRQKIILSLDYERGVWRIGNWLEKSHDTSGSILVRMEKYLGQ